MSAGEAASAGAVALATGVLLAFLALPLVALFFEAPLTDVPSLLGRDVVQDAIWVTVRTNAIANVLVLLFCTPAAWVLATRDIPGRALLITLTELPLVLPPAVAGIALLSAFGTEGLVGPGLSDVGIVLPFNEWAVVFAIAFVSSPFYLRQAIAAFGAIDPALPDVARTLGAGRVRTFWRVVLPLAAGGLVAGWVLSFARGVGEFGATIIFAGSVQGETQTLTLAVYDQLNLDFDVALAISVLLVVMSAGVLLSYKLVSSWRASRWTSPLGGAPSRSTSP